MLGEPRLSEPQRRLGRALVR
ncbi:MAG: hypothetical protein QOD96_4464, partial [Pseudonocardiales bacterium]|nr:hypothetical protein [Pseudonocardiales bacterium]